MTPLWLILILACATPFLLWLALAVWLRFFTRRDP